MKDAEKARKLLDVISVVASNVVEKRLDNVVQTKLAYVTSITYNTNGNAIYRVRLSSSNSDEFECPKLCINELSVGDYVWLNYIGDITNAYIAMPVEPSPAQDVIRNTVAYNMLDNSDFTNPVNQRRNTSYSGIVYTIDRWKLSTSTSSVNVVQGSGITFPQSEKQSILIQRFPLGSLAGKTLTFAVGLSTGEIVSGSKVFPGSGSAVVVVTQNNVFLSFDARSGADDVRIGQSANSASANTVKWAALYEGEYTAETLPKYMPKGYTVELLACTRQYQYFNRCLLPAQVHNSAKGLLISPPLMFPMRTTPSINIKSFGWVRGNGQAITSIPSYTVSTFVPNNTTPVFSIVFDTALNLTNLTECFVLITFELDAGL